MKARSRVRPTARPAATNRATIEQEPKIDLTKRHFTQAIAKDGFIPLVKLVAETQKRVYVKDKNGNYFMTIDPKERANGHPILDVSAQFFKSKFGPMINLIKIDRQFRVRTRDSNRAVYVRRHTSYKDPLGKLNEQWVEMLTESIAQQHADNHARVEREEHAATRARVGDVANTLENLRKLTHRIARVAIGHYPDQEGMLPNGSPFDKDETDPED